MITRRELARALTSANVSDWTIVERVGEVGIFDEARALRRTEQRTRSTVIAHQDQPSGRGTVRLDVAAHANARELVDEALRLATSAIGPAWKSSPPAAPARVDVHDKTLDNVDLVEMAVRTVKAVRATTASVGAKAVEVSSAVTVMRERVTVQSRAGLDATWRASAITAQLLVVAGDHSLELARDARLLGGLGLGDAVGEAVKDLQRLATAKAPKPGRCAVILATDAMLHPRPGEHAGVWWIFAAQADAVLERQGLTRYKPGAAIVPGGSSLTVTSDGALAHATLSAPIGDDGDAIRRFTLVDRGIATGLGMTAREAAMRGADPNGGVRNLVVGKGNWDGTAPTKRTIEIRRLRALAIDPHTGDASLEIALGIDRDGASEVPFTGGTVRLDLISALALARRSAKTVQRAGYDGPASILVEDAELSA